MLAPPDPDMLLSPDELPLVPPLIPDGPLSLEVPVLLPVPDAPEVPLPAVPPDDSVPVVAAGPVTLEPPVISELPLVPTPLELPLLPLVPEVPELSELPALPELPLGIVPDVPLDPAIVPPEADGVAGVVVELCAKPAPATPSSEIRSAERKVFMLPPCKTNDDASTKR